MNSEPVLKALHSLEFAAGDLREAYASADPVSAIVLCELMARANSLHDDVKRLLEALEQ